MNVSKTKDGGGIGVHAVGKINREIYRCITDDIKTDEVIITDERIQHIRERHPGDYERFCSVLPTIVFFPDYIIRDDRPNTAMVLKQMTDSETGERVRLSLRLVTTSDEQDYKNSILTFMKIRKKEYERILRNKEILYKRE